MMDDSTESTHADAKSETYSPDKEAAAFAAKAAAQMRRENSMQIHKEAMEAQAKQIQNNFTESVQKHDISMRLEKVRAILRNI
jgi:hypothetical protein